jgi:molybdopterin biosynthesis enzyme
MTKFKMTQEDMEHLLAAMRPVPMIMLQCGNSPSQQDSANEAWRALGLRMGFKHMTVKPDGSNPLCFMAEPTT